MNALIGYRNNSLGNLSVTRTQREEVSREITSTFRAKLAASTPKSTHATPAATTTTATAPASDGALGRDAFLQLLVLQLQNQDPLEPTDNGQMIAQLAQFSSLEGITNLNGSFETLSGNVDQLNFISAQGLIGKYVEGVNDSGEVAVGTVDSVYLDGSIVVLNVDGEIVSMSNVLSIADGAPEADATTDDAPNESNNGEKRSVIQRLGSSITHFMDKF